MNINETSGKEADVKAELIFYTIQIRKAAMLFRVVNHGLRLQLLQLIYKKGKVAVTDLFIALRLEQSVASQHLAILRRAGVVNIERKGKYRLYCINPERLNEISEYAKLLSATPLE